MKVVLTVHLTKLRNAEYYQLMSRTKHYFSGELRTKYNLIDRFQLFDDCMTLFDGLFAKNKKAEETPEVQAARKVRNSMFIGIKEMLRGLLRSGSPAQIASAKKIEFLLDPYKGANADGNASNSGLIHKFIADVMEEDTYFYITNLNLNNQIDELITLSDAFDDILYKRSQKYQAAKEADKLVEVRKKMNVAYRNLIAKVNALYLIADDDAVEPTKADIGKLIDDINGVIFEMSRTISRRRGVNIIINEENKDDENSTGPIELNGEEPHE
jgi:hypothetical protein